MFQLSACWKSISFAWLLFFAPVLDSMVSIVSYVLARERSLINTECRMKQIESNHFVPLFHQLWNRSILIRWNVVTANYASALINHFQQNVFSWFACFSNHFFPFPFFSWMATRRLGLLAKKWPWQIRGQATCTVLMNDLQANEAVLASQKRKAKFLSTALLY